MSSEFGKRLKIMRTERNLTVRQLADLAGVGSGTVSRIESNAVSPTIDVAQKLADALHADLSVMIGPSRAKAVLVKSENQAKGQDQNNRHQWLVATSLFERSGMVVVIGTLAAHTEPRPFTTLPLDQEEALVLINGRLTVVVDDETFELGEGDALFFSPIRSYQLANKSDAVVEYLLITARQ